MNNCCRNKAICLDNRGHIMNDKSNLIAAEQAANYLNLSKGTLANWRAKGFPKLPYVKLGGSVKYRINDLDAYLESQSHNAIEA